MNTILLWAITVALLSVGIAGTLFPAVPGLALVFVGILFYAIATGFSTISTTTIVLFGIVVLIGLLADFWASVAATSAGGGSARAIAGVIIGSLVGMIAAGPPGLFIGAFMGAFAGAILSGQSYKKATKVALYSIIGMVGSALIQLLLALVLTAAFVITVIR